MLQPMVLKSYEKYFFTKFDRKYQVLPDVSQKIKFEKKNYFKEECQSSHKPNSFHERNLL